VFLSSQLITKIKQVHLILISSYDGESTLREEF